MRRLIRAVRDSRGFSVIEVLVAVAVFAFAIMAMATSSGLIAKQMNIARRDMRLAFAAQYKLEELRAAGYDSLTNGSDTVDVFPMTWTVQGTSPKTVVLVATYTTPSGAARADTVITVVAQP